MPELLTTSKTSVIERASLAGRGMRSHRQLRVVLMGLVAAVFGIFVPEVTHAGTIIGFDAGSLTRSATEFSAENSISLQCQAFDGIDIALDDETGAGASTPSQERPKPQGLPENQDGPQADLGLDLGGGGTTSAPAPGGGSAPASGLFATTGAVATSVNVRWIALLEDLAIDSPSLRGLLDPPKA